MAVGPTSYKSSHRRARNQRYWKKTCPGACSQDFAPKKNLLKVDLSGSGALDTDVQKSDHGVKWPNEVKRGTKTRPTMV